MEFSIGIDAQVTHPTNNTKTSVADRMIDFIFFFIYWAYPGFCFTLPLPSTITERGSG